MSEPLLTYRSIDLQSIDLGAVRHRKRLNQEIIKKHTGKKKTEEKEEKELDPIMIEKLNRLATVMIEYWDIHVQSIELIQGGQMALVWKLLTDRGPLCLKRIHRPEKKALFSIYAQDYLAEKGTHVPGIIANRKGRLYTKQGPFLFVVYDWIEGRPFDTSVSEDLARMMQGLARYHLDSTGYTPPEGIPVFTKLGQWPKHYMKRCLQMESWKLIARQTPDDPFCRLYLAEIDAPIHSGADTLKKLIASGYSDWVQESRESPGLCHQDYGTGNTLLSDDQTWIIDLDTTTFDLPVRDLRKMIIPLMGDQGEWDEELFRSMIQAYEDVRPLTQVQKKIMLTDMLFPYELYETVNEKFGRKNDPPTEELEQALAYEEKKGTEINRLISNI